MSDEMPKGIMACLNPGATRVGEWGAFKINGATHYTRTDWLRSQIEKLRMEPLCGCNGKQGRCNENAISDAHNAALDQILTLLETGEKK